jgi:hypothetical protein
MLPADSTPVPSESRAIRRSTAFTRSASSRTLNGFTT